LILAANEPCLFNKKGVRSTDRTPEALLTARVPGGKSRHGWQLGDKTSQRLKMFCTIIGTLADEYANNSTGECRPPVTPKIETQSFR
jgi:hypothetical protein